MTVLELDPATQLIVGSYVAYLALAIGVTVLVGRTLHRNGRIFLVDAFGDASLADSVNHLLIVGLYLVNIGIVALGVRIGGRPESAPDAIELLSTKVGSVLLILGAMHFTNLLFFSVLRRRAVRANA